MTRLQFPRRVAADVLELFECPRVARRWVEDGLLGDRMPAREELREVIANATSRAVEQAAGAVHASACPGFSVAMFDTPTLAARAHAFAMAGEPESRPYHEWDVMFDAELKARIKKYTAFFAEEIGG